MVKKIINVLKQNYINNVGMGIGDYIRGSFFLLQFCKEYNIEFDLDFTQHPLSKYLLFQKDSIEEEKIDYDMVMYLHVDMITYQDFMNNYIFHQNEENYYLYTNNYPMNIISEDEKTIIKNKFIPNQELICEIENVLNKLKLIKKEFNVIHIRVGDRYFNSDNKLDDKTLNDIYDILDNNINSNEKYLLLSDSNELKVILKNKYKKLEVEIYDILHLAGDLSNEKALKNTLVDFFIMTFSKYIIGLSIYNHNTGFSQYCSIINNIPYKSVRLNNYFNQ